MSTSWLADLPPQRLTDIAWEYSSASYALLDMALAHRGGQPYERLLKSRIIEPIGLHDTTPIATGTR